MLSERAFRAQLVAQGQRELYDYWLQTAGSRRMPARSDINAIRGWNLGCVIVHCPRFLFPGANPEPRIDFLPELPPKRRVQFRRELEYGEPSEGRGRLSEDTAGGVIGA